MRANLWRWLGVVCIALTLTMGGHGDEPKGEKKPNPRDVKELMRKKLELSQQLLASLVVNDLDRVVRDATLLAEVRKNANFRVVGTKQYETWSNEFGSNLDDLLRAAKEKNLEAAKLKYLGLTLTCFNCHNYVRDLGDISTGPAVGR